MSAPELSCRRLVLRALQPEDVPGLGRLNSDPRVTRYLNTEPMTLAEATDRARRHWPDLHDGRFGLWAIARRDDGRLVGTASLDPFGDGRGAAEIAYRLLPEAWGRGLAGEAAARLIDHGFSTLGVRQVNAVAHPRNAASQSILERLGLRYTGLCRAHGFMFARLFRRDRLPPR
ncbi:GNAT family N-acetyltransferase [Zavarzinia compransoris]|uniref:N-acetyltransferase n=1 Tax=Zavarzinia compransoris TaxID=1264899 RepID=A0A317EE62_9PROT|nr:GNAT family N-acetyltransferase [Zavarzinia compransoris]PWR23643.1 N-acetyltransferase [Zavarzinia compransoris]TDP47861.1 ribosomal-protein-alanine N-acetyltransferase [Zavarzinia compransoris]